MTSNWAHAFSHKITFWKWFLFVNLFNWSIHSSGQGHLMGMQLGVNFSDRIPIPKNDPLITKKLTGITYGFNYGYEFKNGLFLNTGLEYIQRGFYGYGQIETFYNQKIPSSVAIKNVNEYLAIPIDIGFKYGKQFKITGSAGLMGSYKLKSYTIVPGQSNASGLDYVFNTSDAHIDLSLSGSVGAEYNVLERVILFGRFIYQRGLTQDYFVSDYSYGSEYLFHSNKVLLFGIKLRMGKN